jgi:hypothetical protein
VTGLATKIGCGKTLHYLSLFSTALIKKLIGSETEAESEETSDSRNSAITELCSRVNCTQSTLKLALRELLVFDQELNKARRQLTSTTNPNPQLLLESILWQWDKLPLVVE